MRTVESLPNSVAQPLRFGPKLLNCIRYLWLVAGRAGRSPFLAPPPKKLPAGGTEVTGLRDYAPGDDIRHIDWAWCARRDELLTKLYEGHVDLHSYVLLDCSRSMGAISGAKWDLARQVAAAIGYAAVMNQQCFGVVAFAAGLAAELPLLRGQRNLPRLFHFLEYLELSPGATDLLTAAEGLGRRRQRRGPVVVISDLYDPRGFEGGVEMLAQCGYHPRVVHIIDPAEADTRLLGDIDLLDAETGAVHTVTMTERMVAAHRRLYTEFARAVARYCKRRVIPCLQLSADMSIDTVLLRIFGIHA